MREDNLKIIFYDGDCGFCNTSVQFVLKHEKRPEIYFSALQSDFAKDFFESNHFPIPDLSTFYFYESEKLYSKSTAGLRVMSYLKFPYPSMIVFRIFPRIIRDLVYDFIAKRRKRIMKGFCIVPTVEYKARFLINTRN